jgi:hypothetical protein
MKSKRGRRERKMTVVPRAVFAVALALASVPSAAACRPDPAPRGRAAQLRPAGPPRSPAPRLPDLGTDAASDLGLDLNLGGGADLNVGGATGAEPAQHRKRPRPPPPPPRYWGVALGVAAWGVAMGVQ